MLREIYNFSLHLSPTKQHFDSMKNIDMVSTNVTWSLNFYGPPSFTKQQYVDSSLNVYMIRKVTVSEV